MIPMPAISTFFGIEEANDRHSAYSFRWARIAYRWHPLFDRDMEILEEASAAVLAQGEAVVLRVLAQGGEVRRVHSG